MLIQARPARHYPKYHFGQSWLNYNHESDRSYVFVSIPKNASSWMNQVMTSAGLCWHYDYRKAVITSANDHPLTSRAQSAPKTYVAILRDPLNRWLSGIAQNQQGIAQSERRHWSKRGLDDIVRETVLDDHTEPQVSFLSGIDTNHTVWFDWHTNLSASVWHWINQHLPWIPTREFDRNTSDQQKISVSEISQALDSRSDLQEHIRLYYNADYRLRDAVSFYSIT